MKSFIRNVQSDELYLSHTEENHVHAVLRFAGL